MIGMETMSAFQAILHCIFAGLGWEGYGALWRNAGIFGFYCCRKADGERKSIMGI